MNTFEKSYKTLKEVVENAHCFYLICSLTAKDDRAITNMRLKTAEPAMLPIATLLPECIAPITLVSNSGIEEPNAIIVAPAISDLNPN